MRRLLFLAPLLALSSAAADAQQLAFPGAEGYGRFAEGGRGGDVYHVTNTDDSGAGSLRECIEAVGARTCVFDVGGIWTSETALIVSNPLLTIAGETAPPPGVTLKLITTPDTDPFIIDADDVIVRFIAAENGRRTGSDSNTRDGLSVTEDAENVILDHVSVRFGIDETLEISACNLTVQNSIIAWGLEDAGHNEGLHSKAVLAQGGGTGGLIADCHVSMIRMLVAHSNDRMPEYWGNYERVQIVNMFSYNPDQSFHEAKTADQHDSLFDVISSVCKPGPATSGTVPPCFDLRGPVGAAVGTISHYSTDILISGAGTLYGSTDAGAGGVANPDYIRDTPTEDMPTIADVIPAADLETEMLPYIGRTLPYRDFYDEKAVTEAIAGTGNIQNSIPTTIASTVVSTVIDGFIDSCPCDWRIVDTDGDGMPNTYERANDFDPFDDADGVADEDSDGYTNFEEYLHYRASLAPSAG